MFVRLNKCDKNKRRRLIVKIDNILKLNRKLKSLLLVFLISLLICSSTLACTTGVNPSSDSLHKESDKYLSFYDEKDGKDIHWEANFDDGEIVSLYRDGEKIPEDEIKNHKRLINKKLDEMRYGLRQYSFKMDNFRIDLDDFHKEMQEFRNQMPKHWEHWKDFEYDFDEKQFEENLENLKEKLEKMKDRKFELRYDSETFKKYMEELQEHLKNQQFDFDDFEFDFDFDEDFNDQSFLFNFDLDLDGFKNEMESLNDELANMDFRMEEIDKKLENLDALLKEMKKELVKDGYISDEEDDAEIKLSGSELVVNGKTVAVQLFEKY